MGSSGSVEERCCCLEKCVCFEHDVNIKKYPVIRYSVDLWQWNKDHDDALIDTLYIYYAIPKEIVFLIKDHSHHVSQNYYITRPMLINELYHSQLSLLSTKRLCKYWYSKQCSSHPLFIAFHVTGSVFICFSISICVEDEHFALHFVDYRQIQQYLNRYSLVSIPIIMHCLHYKIILHYIWINITNSNALCILIIVKLHSMQSLFFIMIPTMTYCNIHIFIFLFVMIMIH